MTWVRFDDHYPINRKVAGLSDGAYRLDSEAIMWSNRETTDGIIRAHELNQVRAKANRKQAAELVDAGRWHAAGDVCVSDKCPPSGPDGWVIHDYLEYQPTREKVLADRAAKAERQRVWMEKRRATGRTTSTSAGASHRPSTSTSLDASTQASADAPLTHAPYPYPVPAPAPEGKRVGDLPVAQPAANGGRPSAGSEQKTICRTCGNAVTSAYHLGPCLRSDVIAKEGA